MNRRCDDIHPLIFRVHEGEATPDQAIRVARHLSDCTTCRIIMAREKRLAEMLRSELDELAVGEDFVDSVMATLPKEPPRRKPRSRAGRLRGLKLASLTGLVGLVATQGLPGLSGHANLPARFLPQFTFEGGPSWPEGIGALAQIVAAVAGALGQVSSETAPVLLGLLESPLLATLALAAAAGLVAVTGTSAIVALAARSLFRLV